MAELFANSGDPDQMPHFVASDLDLHCLPVTLLGVTFSWRKKKKKNYEDIPLERAMESSNMK